MIHRDCLYIVETEAFVDLSTTSPGLDIRRGLMCTRRWLDFDGCPEQCPYYESRTGPGLPSREDQGAAKERA